MNPTALLNRLDKNRRHLAKWARREGLEAYRLYDRDMPEFPLAIDLYGEALHVQVFERKRPFEETQLAQLLDALLQHFNLRPDQLAIKTRRRQRGLSQYQKLADQPPSFDVVERGLRFEVNLHRYLDTGLFLDHRDTRQRVRQQAQGKSVLNLFAYTGSFSVYAAAGGARRTITVDMSRTYQDWSARNLTLNGLSDEKRHQLVQADVLDFLARLKEARELFDLVILDPPSFSNSKRMHATFDVQRDHLLLLRNTLAVLHPEGELLFSNNRQGFQLDPAVSEMAEVNEITGQTVPLDFRRHRPHHCWVLRKALT